MFTPIFHKKISFSCTPEIFQWNSIPKSMKITFTNLSDIFYSKQQS